MRLRPTMEFLEARQLLSGTPTATARLNDIVSGRKDTYAILMNYSDDQGIDSSTIGTGDIEVVYPDGRTEVAVLRLSGGDVDGPRQWATYEIGSRGEILDNGSYSVRIRESEVFDTDGNAVLAGELGTFRVDVDRIPPEAVAVADTIISPGPNSQFTVVYTDDVAFPPLDSLENDFFDSVALAPVERNGTQSRLVTPVSFAATTNEAQTNEAKTNNSITVTYQIGDSLSHLDNGEYYVRMSFNDDRVSDENGNLVTPGNIGELEILIERTETVPPAFDVDVEDIVSETVISKPPDILVTYRDPAGVVLSDWNASSIFVVAPDGGILEPRPKRTDFVDRRAFHETLTVHDEFRGREFNEPLMGRYSIWVRPDHVSDSYGNYLPTMEIGSFTIDAPVDTEPPVVGLPSFGASSFIQDTMLGVNTYIRVFDNVGVDYGKSVANDALEIVAPNGAVDRSDSPGNSGLQLLDGSFNTSLAFDNINEFFRAHGNGVYTLRLRENSVQDTSGNFAAAQDLAEFRVYREWDAPSAVAQAIRAEEGIEVTVTYEDKSKVYVHTTGNDDLEIVSPGGAIYDVRRTSRSPANNAAVLVTATYHVNFPELDAIEPGRYSIRMRPEQVIDRYGNAVEAGEIGSFLVNDDGEIEPSVVDAVVGDVDSNGKVDFTDFLIFAEHFGNQNADRSMGDFNGDGIVGFDDFLALSTNFGK